MIEAFICGDCSDYAKKDLSPPRQLYRNGTTVYVKLIFGVPRLIFSALLPIEIAPMQMTSNLTAHPDSSPSALRKSFIIGALNGFILSIIFWTVLAIGLYTVYSMIAGWH